MKKEVHILITAGRGPVECGYAVHGVQRKFREFLDRNEVPFQIISQKTAADGRTTETIVFKVVSKDKILLDSWLGTIQWICKSPIRKYNKRKNWFIKALEIQLAETIETDMQALTIQSYKASGPGGQHRNKVETAIRIIHKPTGLIVTASDNKSKAQNKKAALKKLKEKLEAHTKNLQEDHAMDIWSSKIEIERGNPIKTFYGPKFIEL